MKPSIQEIVIDGKTYVPKGCVVAEVFKDINELKDLVGKSFYFRAVTYHLVGTVVKQVSENVFQLENAAWVADTERFMQAIQDGKLKEVEPVGTAFINLDTVTDFFPWKHELPLEQI